MGKSARRRRQATPSSTAEAGAPAPRQPCPCGSGLRYKACHGSSAGPPPRRVARPFQGLRAECDLIALRELVPAATVPVTLRPEYAGPDGRRVQLCTLLPMAAPALVRGDGTVWLGLQVRHAYGDPSRDLAAVLLRALDAPAGEVVGLPADPGEGPRLQDVLVDEPWQVTVHEGFGFWLEGGGEDGARDDADVAAALERAEAVAQPTRRLETVPAAYWTAQGAKEHLRWVMPHEEDALLTALARLHADGRDTLVPGSRLAGTFRAHGLLCPVWDLEPGTGAHAVAAPAAAFEEALAGALADGSPLSGPVRSARAGLAGRQITLL